MSEREVRSEVPFSFAKCGSKTNGRIGVRVRSATLEKECSATGATAAMRWTLCHPQSGIRYSTKATTPRSVFYFIPFKFESSVRMRVEMEFRA